MRHDEAPEVAVQSQEHEAGLVLGMLRIAEEQCLRIREYGSSLFKCDPMFLAIRYSLP